MFPEPVVLVVGSIVFVLVLVVAVLGCSMCQNRSGFKDFSDDVEMETSGGVYTVEDETMFAPPFDSVPNTPHKVEFEPLPTVNRLKRVLLTSQLLPKISHVDRKKTNFVTDVIKCEFSRNQVQYIKELGNGWFGKALLGEAAKISVGMKRTKVVVKQLNEEASQEECSMFMEEVKPYREIDHPNILKLLGECTEVSPFLTILEYFSSGDMKSFLLSHREQKHSLAQQGILLNFACDLTAGVSCLHQHKYIHHDLALRNCMVTADMSVKIGDYGVAEDVYKDDYFMAGSESIPVRWCAPETVDCVKKQIVVKPYNQQANVWSLGVCLWEIFEFARQPYSDLSNENVVEYVILQGRVKLAKPLLNVKHIDKLYDLMEHCWLVPPRRPSVDLLHKALEQLKSMENKMVSDEQWNKLLPRMSPVVGKAASPVNGGGQLSDKCFSTNFLPSSTDQLSDVHGDGESNEMNNGLSDQINGDHTGEDNGSFKSQPPFGGHMVTSTPVKKSPRSDSSEYVTPNSTMKSGSDEVSNYNSCQDKTLTVSDIEATMSFSRDDTFEEPVSV